jgi:integrase
VKAVKHHAALPWQDVSAFMVDLRKRSGIGARALEFTVLTAARSGKVRHAQWDEINGDLWIVPAERMKARREHRVPLSPAALTLLDKMPRIEGCPLIFPGTRMSRLSDMSLSAVLKRMDLGAFTVHGFGSTFRDWAAERTDHDRDAVEMALALTIGSKTEAAYRRGDMLPKRMKLMADWAEWFGA